MSDLKPIVPVTPEQRERLAALPGVIVLIRRPGANAYEGYVEHSFSMDYSGSHVNFWWQSPEHDGKRYAEAHAADIRRHHQDWEVEVWDARDPKLPVTLDWEVWIEAQAHNPNTLSGVSNKFAARNIPFRMREEADG